MVLSSCRDVLFFIFVFCNSSPKDPFDFYTRMMINNSLFKSFFTKNFKIFKKMSDKDFHKCCLYFREISKKKNC